MKDNKLYKVLRIIFLTLAIISLVFTLCKKVGLCASSSTPNLYSDFPLPFGSGQGMDNVAFDDSVVSELLNQFSASASNGSMEYIFLEEVTDSTHYNIVTVNNTSGSPLSISNTGSFPNATVSVGGWVVHWTISGSSVTFTSYAATNINLNVISYVDSAPNGSYALKSGNLYHYPIWSKDNQAVGNLNGDFFVFDSGSSGGGSDSSWNDVEFPEYDSLPNDIADSSSPDYNLYSWLNGQNENNYDYTKSIFDLIKGFFSWFTAPFDSEAASDSLESIQVFSDIRSLNNVIGTAGIFDWSDVTPASRVAFTFDFGGAVLPHHQYEINFDWYTGTVKTLILSILVTFLVVGLLVTIINNIPSMIHGHSGDSGGGSN